MFRIYTTFNTYGLFKTVEQVVHFLYKHQEITFYNVYHEGGYEITGLIKQFYKEKYGNGTTEME